MSATILVVDDEKTFRLVAEAALRTEGYEVVSAATAREGLALARARDPEIVILDRNLPDADGLSVLQRLVADAPAGGPLVVIATAYGDMDNAIQALKSGAFDYLTKPLQLPELIVTVRKALEAKALRRRAAGLSSTDRRRLEQRMFQGTSTTMRRAVELCEKVARSPDTTVLLQGESGTGKELLARLIHVETPRRRESPFVDLNCAAVPEPLLETELFGHEPGAFTDAKREKPGLLEQADGGTVFLDEIGDMPLATQAKLLKVIETQVFRRLGGVRDLSVDVRFVAATHRDLEAAVRNGTFRLDLFHRLAVFPVRVPALRDRPEDVLPLARFFLEAFARRAGKAIRGLAPETERKLQAYAFPGNVRELRNLVERAVILETEEVLTPASILLGEATPAPPAAADAAVRELVPPGGPPPTLAEVERAYLVRLLERAAGNRSQVARWMGVSYPTVVKKIADYGIEVLRRPARAASPSEGEGTGEA